MQQYNVPQFVEVEDTIFGPLTLRQFLAILAGAIVVLFIYLVFDLGLFFWLLGLPVAALTLFVALANINGRSVLSHFFPFISFFLTPKKRIFRREEPELVVTKKVEAVVPTGLKPQEVQSRLRRLAYILDQKSTTEEDIMKSQIPNSKPQDPVI